MSPTSELVPTEKVSLLTVSSTFLFALAPLTSAVLFSALYCFWPVVITDVILHCAPGTVLQDVGPLALRRQASFCLVSPEDVDDTLGDFGARHCTPADAPVFSLSDLPYFVMYNVHPYFWPILSGKKFFHFNFLISFLFI